jgi:radical SAM superfamily enzyme YgiQ (UPF0313 family)
MGGGYFVFYSPLIYNLMDVPRRESSSPIHLVSYLTGRNGLELSAGNYLDYLEFDLAKHREGMVETLAIASYAALHVGNQIASLAPRTRVIHADDKVRTLRAVIAGEGHKPTAVFITAMSPNFPTAVVASIVLNRAKIPVVLGGIHVSTSTHDVDTFIRAHCRHPELVSQVRGAGDSTVIAQVLHDLERHALQREYVGLRMMEDGVWVDRRNVDYLPPLPLDLLPTIPGVGRVLADRVRLRPVAPFVGCPHSCKFCSISTLPRNQRQLTARGTTDFVDELADRRKNGKRSRFFFFLPDNLLLGGKRLDAMLDEMVRRDLRVNFVAQVSIDVASKDALLKKLRAAGATHFFIGFESLDIRNLEYIDKHVLPAVRRSGLPLPQYYAQQIRKIQNHGISVHGAFILGLPYDYFRSFDDNTGTEIADFCIRNHIGLQPCSLTDLPGSRMFQESQRRGTYLYGTQGTMQYLLALCLTDLTETNRLPPVGVFHSPLVTACMAFEAVRRAGDNRHVIANAVHMARKAFEHPTAWGTKKLHQRLIDTMYAFASQVIVGLYRKHGERVTYSASGIRGAIERLYDSEKDPHVKAYFDPYVRRFAAGTKRVRADSTQRS